MSSRRKAKPACGGGDCPVHGSTANDDTESVSTVKEEPVSTATESTKSAIKEEKSETEESKVEGFVSEDNDDNISSTEIDVSHLSKVALCIHSHKTKVEATFHYNDETKDEFVGNFKFLKKNIGVLNEANCQFVVSVVINHNCVWDVSGLDKIAQFLLATLPAIDFEVDSIQTVPPIVPFVKFYKTLHPIVQQTQIDGPVFLTHCEGVEIKYLKIKRGNLPYSYFWRAIKYIKVLDVGCVNNYRADFVPDDTELSSSDLDGFECEPNVIETLKKKFANTNDDNQTPEATVNCKKYIDSTNHSRMTYELFAHIDSMFNLFDRVLNWNRDQHDILINFEIAYDGFFNNGLEKEITKLTGYYARYEDEKIRLELKQFNVCLKLVVKEKTQLDSAYYFESPKLNGS
ncbi:unnamed protein product [Bursaphelenchus okinawaensis]|uniref:Uncharacterized protein n=1 Tax=Bursaphelenchus okinawaensis TaxID=465554 RepID=A0A811LSV6_9BILA|nr:unnamed protein product [Bursaphelenchus okinawaensis]CAG9127765.1 unnamed protein product [Bursaphelenchus okinawaensis]